MAGTNKKPPSEDLFYRDLGRAIRTARNTAGKSQEDVAAHLNVTFQQMQKYETGKNRIPVDRLVSLASYLEKPLSQFVESSDDESEFRDLAAQFRSGEFHALMEAWVVLKDRSARAALLNVAKAMAKLSR